MKNLTHGCVVVGIVFTLTLAASAQQPQRGQAPPPNRNTPPAASRETPSVTLPLGYTIGPEDILSIVYWREKDMSMDVQVRPDGKISLPLINDVLAAGQTPEQLRQELTEKSKEFFEDPNVTVIVKEIRSRRVFIQGQVGKIGPYPLSGPMTVMQLIAMAGGLGEYADSSKIIVLRTENGKPVAIKVNYKELIDGKKLQQNVELKPGDTVVVP